MCGHCRGFAIIAERRELHVLKYWSRDAQLEAVEQRLRHFVAARRYMTVFKNLKGLP